MKNTSTILEQNYFTFHNINYSQITGLAMGAPSSAILSEIYLQHLEHTRNINILTQHNIRGYFRYVDDILVIYEDDLTNIHEVHEKLNRLSPTIKFTLENENEHHINSLDITIHNNDNKLSFSIYRKPTASDVIFPMDSCHPLEHKYAAIRYMLERLHKYRLNGVEKRLNSRS
jgi:queuine/archaeosine tRNA-ribosyltransferase